MNTEIEQKKHIKYSGVKGKEIKPFLRVGNHVSFRGVENGLSGQVVAIDGESFRMNWVKGNF